MHTATTHRSRNRGLGEGSVVCRRARSPALIEPDALRLQALLQADRSIFDNLIPEWSREPTPVVAPRDGLAGELFQAGWSTSRS